jgi:glutathione S-transferase
MINIYDFPHGARGLRAAWLCEEMGLAHTFVPVGFPPDVNYRELNPFGTVPFLQDDDVSMSESVAIMLYIAEKYGPTDALPRVDDERFAKVLQFTLLGGVHPSGRTDLKLELGPAAGRCHPRTRLGSCRRVLSGACGCCRPRR